jgi:hypothetical protein
MIRNLSYRVTSLTSSAISIQASTCSGEGSSSRFGAAFHEPNLELRDLAEYLQLAFVEDRWCKQHECNSITIYLHDG